MVRAALSLSLAALVLSFGLGAPAPASAQGLLGLNSGQGPLEIDAEQGIEWRRKERLYIARGKARAARGDFAVYAEVLTAHYRNAADGGTEIFRIDADGDVRLVSPGETVYAENGIYDLDRGLVFLRGGNLRLETERDIVRARDSLEYWEEQRVAVARGDAVATREGQELRADVLTAYFRPNAEKNLEMKTVRADGNVRITTPSEFARGNGGVYYVDKEFATLTGEVKITRGVNQLNGEYAEVDMKTGVSRLLGAPPGQPGDTRARGLMVPKPEGETDGGS